MAMASGQGHQRGASESLKMHEMGTISTTRALGLIVVTFAALLLVLALAEKPGS